MKKGNPDQLPPHLQAELEALAAAPDSDIDRTDPDCLPTNPADWKGAARGALFRSERPFKQSLTLRLDADVVDWFRRSGDGYQTRMNAALRAFMMQHRNDPG